LGGAWFLKLLSEGGRIRSGELPRASRPGEKAAIAYRVGRGCASREFRVAGEVGMDRINRINKKRRKEEKEEREERLERPRHVDLTFLPSR